MSGALKLSDGISTLRQELALFANLPDEAEVTIEAPQARRLHKILTVMHSLAIDMEVELACFRDMEAGRQGRASAEETATDSLSILLEEAGGKIIRPDFGRRNDRA